MSQYYNPSSRETKSLQSLCTQYNTSIPASREEFKGWYKLYEGTKPEIDNPEEYYIEKGVIRFLNGHYTQTYYKQMYSVIIINTRKIEVLKQKLRQYDYIGVKIATGCATKEEYAEEIALCQSYRNEINELQAEIDRENANNTNSEQ